MAKAKGIPTPLLSLLKYDWKPYDICQDYWEIHRRDTRRWNNPSFYGRGSGSVGRLDWDNRVMDFEETVAVGRLPQFNGLIHTHSPIWVTVNEHAEHAVSAFCSQAFAALRQLESRLEETPRTS